MTTETTTKQDRWDRLAADLQAAGINARLDRRPYQQIEYGRMVHGVSSSITVLVPGKGLVHVGDKHGRRGKWYGWTVTPEDREGIALARPTWAQTKRSVTVAEVQAALAKVGA